MHENSLNRIVFRVLALCAFLGTIQTATSADEQSDFFETKIRPVLIEKCISCHGPSKQTSGLRLDSREAMLEGGDSGPVLVPGKKEESLLFQAAAHTGDASKMPPKNSKSKPFEASQVADLGKWIQNGAVWPAGKMSASEPSETTQAAIHWAFQPIKHAPPVPSAKSKEWNDNPIDAFIADKLEKANLSASELADRPTIIRRLSFDLLGLPPTPEEIKAFLNDPDTDDKATETLVDRLLASPHFGERFARHWLDLARYSDTKGYVFQEDRRYPFAYTFRDYVIRSFNNDLPYSQFIIEQIAADKIPAKEDNNHLAAMGYLTVGRRFLNNQNDIIDDRIDLVGRSLMGLTIACARCHDHKFDPIPTADYYSIYGVFASSSEPKEGPILETTGQSVKRKAYEEAIAKAQGDIDKFFVAKANEFRNEIISRPGEYLEAAAELKFDVLGRGKTDEIAERLKLRPELISITGTRWSNLLKEIKPETAKVLKAWRDLAELDSSQFATLAESKIKSYTENDLPPALLTKLQKDLPKSRSDLAKAYFLAYSEAKKQEKVAEADQPFVAIFDQEKGLVHFDKQSLERIANRADRNKIKDLQKKVDAINATHPGAPVRAMVLNDNPQPYDPVVFLRGNPGRHGKKVPRQFLEVLSGKERKPFTQGSGRLEFAQSIASSDNPLTSRVWVNRVWMYLIGKPMVESPSDFGVRSDLPSHPELLDWLAFQFTHDDQWHTKKLIKRIVTSRTYRQSSAPRNDALGIDPENRLVHRANRKRIELEPMRDAILAVSGRLDPAVFGPSVDVTVPPYAPRRTLYAYVDRQNLDTFFRTFDFAGPDATSPRRYVTTVPQQALYLMNHPFVQDESRRFGERFAESLNQHPDEALNQMALLAWGRPMTNPELQAAKDFLVDARNEPERLITAEWLYGFGEVDETQGKVVNFLKFPKFIGTAWQFGDSLPHPVGSFNHITAQGGHVGPTVKTATIRRWTSPEAITVSIQGTLTHKSDKGDGVRGWVVSSRQGILSRLDAKNSNAPLKLESISVQAGETIDFVVDCGAQNDHSFDGFGFAPEIRRIDKAGSVWLAADDFGNQSVAVPMKPEAILAQALFQSNAFLFID